jgi:hypothetical protein
MMPPPWRCRNNLDAGLPYFRPDARYDSCRGERGEDREQGECE